MRPPDRAIIAFCLLALAPLSRSEELAGCRDPVVTATLLRDAIGTKENVLSSKDLLKLWPDPLLVSGRDRRDQPLAFAWNGRIVQGDCEDTERIEDFFDDELDNMIDNYFQKKKIPNFKVKDIKLQIIGTFNNKKN